MRYLCYLLIRFYQKFLSPLKRNPTCRFTPTCSAYAISAYLNRGVVAGTFLTLFRILRCNPMCHGGYDPVPRGYLYRMDIRLTDENIDHGAVIERIKNRRTDD